MKLWSVSEQGSKNNSKDTLSDSDRKWVMISLIAVQGFLTVGTIFAFTSGMGSTWQFLLGLNLFVFAGLYRTFRIGLKEKAKKLNEKNSFSQKQFSLTDEKSYLM